METSFGWSADTKKITTSSTTIIHFTIPYKKGKTKISTITRRISQEETSMKGAYRRIVPEVLNDEYDLNVKNFHKFIFIFLKIKLHLHYFSSQK